jgi:hypothetical protein
MCRQKMATRDLRTFDRSQRPFLVDVHAMVAATNGRTARAWLAGTVTTVIRPATLRSRLATFSCGRNIIDVFLQNFDVLWGAMKQQNSPSRTDRNSTFPGCPHAAFRKWSRGQSHHRSDIARTLFSDRERGESRPTQHQFQCDVPLRRSLNAARKMESPKGATFLEKREKQMIAILRAFTLLLLGFLFMAARNTALNPPRITTTKTRSLCVRNNAISQWSRNMAGREMNTIYIVFIILAFIVGMALGHSMRK